MVGNRCVNRAARFGNNEQIFFFFLHTSFKIISNYQIELTIVKDLKLHHLCQILAYAFPYYVCFTIIKQRPIIFFLQLFLAARFPQQMQM